MEFFGKSTLYSCPAAGRFTLLFGSRQTPGAPDRERAFDRGFRVILPVIMELKADQGLSSAGLFAVPFLLTSLIRPHIPMPNPRNATRSDAVPPAKIINTFGKVD
jgi:hypothetical protein